MNEPALTVEWHTDRNLGLRWQPAEAAADPTTSSLWPHYQQTASVTAPNNWSLPGAPLGGSMTTFTMPRLLEPLAYFEKGLELYGELPSPSAADKLVACAMRMGRARLALEMAAEGLKYSYQEAYDIHSDVMGPESADVAKPFELVGQWLSGTAILGITNERWIEVKAVLIFLSQLLARALPGVDPKDLEQLAAMVLQRLANECPNPGPLFEALKEQLDPRSSIRSWIG
jgi:hypothetical protein